MCCMRLAENTGRKNRHFGTIAQLCRAVSSQLRHISTIGKKLLNIDTSFTCPHNMVNFGLLTAEICWRVWGTTANFNGFCVLAALLHGTLVVSVSQTLRRWTEGATYIWQGDHHVGHWPTFQLNFRSSRSGSSRLNGFFAFSSFRYCYRLHFPGHVGFLFLIQFTSYTAF